MSEGEFENPDNLDYLDKGWRERPENDARGSANQREGTWQCTASGHATEQEFRRLKRYFIKLLADGNDSDDGELVSDEQDRAESLDNDLVEDALATSSRSKRLR